MGKIIAKVIAWFMILVSTVLVISCGAKKTEIKKELKASEVVKEKVKTIKENKETKETHSKKEEIILFSEDLDLIADEIIIQEGSKTTTIKKPVLSKKKAESNKTATEETNIATTEEKESVIKSFERIKEAIKNTDKQIERKQFDWGLLLIKLLPIVIIICYLLYSYRKWIKTR